MKKERRWSLFLLKTSLLTCFDAKRVLFTRFEVKRVNHEHQRYLQTPQVPPFFAQCLQYLQFLHAAQDFEPVHVATESDGKCELEL